MSHTFEAEFGIGDKVHIDGDASITLVVTAVSFRCALPEYEVSWWDERTMRAEWVRAWRVTRVGS